MVRARPSSSLLKRFLAASPASSSAGSARATFVSPTAFAFCPSDSCSSLLAIRGRSPLPLRSPGGLVCGARIGLAIAVQRGECAVGLIVSLLLAACHVNGVAHFGATVFYERQLSRCLTYYDHTQQQTSACTDSWMYQIV